MCLCTGPSHISEICICTLSLREYMNSFWFIIAL
uniref:Uncharacterized protein n=1 Tax=Anguilla anguilla TaxID=7936 RepID=A0A0E9UG95_ANGAN